MTDSELKPEIIPQRLCSEIQLFDLCELDSCKQKNGRFCINPVLIGRFEKIAEKELRITESTISDDIDESEPYDGEDDIEFAEEDLEGDEDDA